MSPFKNIAVQAAVILSLTGAIGALLYSAADLATRGVVIG